MRSGRLRRLWRRVEAVMQSRRVERDIHDELSFHIDRETRRLIEAGHAPEDAARQARAAFGSVPLAADQCRDARGLTLVTDVVADIRYACRQYRHRPAVSAAMVAVLALGVGFSTWVFVVFWSLTSGPLGGLRLDDTVVRIRGIDHRRGPGRAVGREFSHDEYLRYAAQTEVFSAVAAWTSIDASIDVGGPEPNVHSGAVTFVTGDYFPVLGLSMTLGSGLTPRDFAESAAPVAVISHALWERFYEASPLAIGRTLSVNGVSVSIAGVAPRRFIGARPGGSAVRVWVPLPLRPRVPSSRRPADTAVFGLVARLQPGVSPGAATTVAQTVAGGLAPPSAAGPARVTSDVVVLRAENYFPPSGDTPGVMGRVAGLSIPLLALLITGTSVAALLAGQALGRRREMAIRLALGAHRPRIIRQLLTESLLLGFGAAVLGLFLVWIVVGLIDATVLGSPLTLDWRTVGFAFILGLASTLLIGVSPALHATRMAVSDVLKEGDLAFSRTRLQAVLVVAQIALTQPALLGMGARLLDVREQLDRQPASLVADQVVDVRFNTNPRYGAMDEAREQSLARLARRLAALPGVMAVVPQGAGEWVHVSAGAGGDAVEVEVQPAPAGALSAQGLTVERGRDFQNTDRTADRLMIVTADLAERLWGTADPVGRTVMADDMGPGRYSGVFTVIGVATSPGEPRVFVPTVPTTSHLLVRTSGPAEPIIPALRHAAHVETPEVPVVSMRTLASIEAAGRASTRYAALAAGVIGLLALALAAVGLYAVVAVAVGQRIREIGVRTALGADRRRIVGLFVRRGVQLSAIGTVVGLVTSLLTLRLLATEADQQTSAADVALAAGICVLVSLVALVAAWIPARRAASVNPIEVLRAE